MKITRLTLLLLMFVLMVSILVANVVNIIDVDLQDLEGAVGNNSVQKKSRWSSPKKFNITNSDKHLLWFLQITDLHISIFQDPHRITDFKEFCDITVGSIKPQIVLASGDLTDAKTLDKMGSRQYVEEWQHYKRVLDDSNVAKRTTWLDVRGNHDNFNVFDIGSKDNYYVNYSVQGHKHARSYMHQITLDSDKFSFIAVDACLKPGPKRPFNFVGALDYLEIEHLESLAKQSRISEADYIVWFGHYPTSCIVSPNSGGVRSIIGKNEESLTYLCGHFHTLAGAVPNMYTLQKIGFLELELADWKDNRMYRLLAIDHGQFSFTDVEHRDWPVALITNPKDAQFAMSHKENIESIIQSTHIRALAFSIVDIKTVKVRINDEYWMICEHIKGPLYVVEWNPENYKTGIQRIQLQVTDVDGRVKLVTQTFSLDGSRLSFGFLPRIALMSDVSRIFQLLFAIIFIALVVPLCALRIYHNTYKSMYGRNHGKPRVHFKLLHWWLRSHWILATVNRLFFPLVFYTIYLLLGPWTVGEIIDNHTGVIFAWGTFIGNSFLPGSFTYAYGFFQLLSFHLPLTLMLAHRANRRLQLIENPPKKPTALLISLCEHLPFILLISLQAAMVYFFWLAYGTVATVLCPLRSWSLILALSLWYQVYRMPARCLRSAAQVWCTHGDLVSNAKHENQSND